MSQGSRPLDGVSVLELATLVAGPAAGTILAGLGARVVKVEPIGGDPGRQLGGPGGSEALSPLFLSGNFGKRSVALNLRDRRAVAVLERMVAEADVVLENMQRDVWARLGLGPEMLVAQHPRLVWVRLSGFPEDGPDSGRPGVDLLLQAESGIMSTTGSPDDDGTRVGFPLVDAAAGHVIAEAVLTGLIGRAKPDFDRLLRVSLMQVALHLQAAGLTHYFQTGVAPVRTGNSVPLTAPAGLFRTRDGSIIIAAYKTPKWAALCEALGLRDFATDPRVADLDSRLANRVFLNQRIESVLATADSDEWIARLHRAGVMAGKVATYPDLAVNRGLRSCGAWLDVAGPDGAPHTVVRPPVSVGPAGPGGLPQVPGVGEHTVEVLAELGFDQQDIETWVEDGVIGAGRTASVAGGARA